MGEVADRSSQQPQLASSMSSQTSMAMSVETKAWWKSAVVYQIYPASFCDSNGDGIGDLNGITSKLDYLKSLGVNVVWLSPIFKSPMVDMGYDTSDYYEINPQFGTTPDLERLISELHGRGMKLMLDLVVNHTSSEHEWFKESRKKGSAKRDWYFWKPAKYDAQGQRQPPNNWKANLGGGSVWEWDEESQEYYLHYYHTSMPDLNFETKAVREAVYDLMRYWLDKGVDGYRMDVIGRISKHLHFPDADVKDLTSPWQEQDRSKEGPKVHEFIQEMNRKVLSKYDIMTVGELPQISMESMILWTRPDRHELQMGFTFDHVLLGLESQRPGPKLPWSRHVLEPWKLPELKSILAQWQGMREAGCWHALYTDNHDQPRSISRFANPSPQFREASGKMLALMHCTMFGTLYIFEGQEIGMINIPDTWPLEDFKDVQTQQLVLTIRDRGEDVESLTKRIYEKSRDNARSPMQWDGTPNAGFTNGKPWMRIPDDHTTWNAANQVKNPSSLWSFWKEMLAIRKTEEDDLVYGKFDLLSPDHEQIFAFTRSGRFLTILNFSDTKTQYDCPAGFGGEKLVKATQSIGSEVLESKITIPPWSGVLYKKA